MRVLLYLVLLAGSLSVQCAFASSSEEEILEVVETFRKSIINKDRETLNSLFYRHDIPFVAVFTNEMMKQRRKDNPEFPRSVDFGQFGGSIDKMIPEDSQSEEQIFAPKVLAFKDVGSVIFRYKDIHEGRTKAHGDELWSLIREEGGWKIISVAFTVTEVPQD